MMRAVSGSLVNGRAVLLYRKGLPENALGVPAAVQAGADGRHGLQWRPRRIVCLFLWMRLFL